MPTRLSRDDLIQVIDLSHRCLAAASLEDLLPILTAVVSMTSFDRAVLCAVGRGGRTSLDHFVNHSFGAEWARTYEARGFERVDPVLRRACAAPGAFRWRDALRAEPSGACRAFTGAARDFGLVEGVAHACNARASSGTTLLSLAGGKDHTSDRTLALVSALGPHLHEAYAWLRGRDRAPESGGGLGEDIALSAREREILAWTQDGKTYWEIGEIIGISERTVKYHFTRIKAKLDVVSASHAVAKAMRMGLLA